MEIPYKSIFVCCVVMCPYSCSYILSSGFRPSVGTDMSVPLMDSNLQSSKPLRVYRHHTGGRLSDLQHLPQEQNSACQGRFSRGENRTMSGINREARTHWLLVLEIRALKLWVCIGQTSKCRNRSSPGPGSGPPSDYGLDHGPTMVRTVVGLQSGPWPDHGPVWPAPLLLRGLEEEAVWPDRGQNSSFSMSFAKGKQGKLDHDHGPSDHGPVWPPFLLRLPSTANFHNNNFIHKISWFRFEKKKCVLIFVRCVF